MDVLDLEEVFGGTLHTTSAQAATDWRTDYEHIEYGTITVPDDTVTAVRRFLAYYGIIFGSFDFAVTPQGEWVNNCFQGPSPRARGRLDGEWTGWGPGGPSRQASWPVQPKIEQQPPVPPSLCCV
ncbi:hypothetical protein [Streptomyces aureus]|uniref:Uncharacterized protein n=1 Tax=Streptomyces aureus TaxID=193461 RepID=A0ABV4T033_9ACTN